MDHLGAVSPQGFAERVPPFNPQIEAEGEYLSLYKKNYSTVRIDENCEEKIVCRFFSMKDWTKGFRDMILPCGYLKYDVCQGTYACECSNGYWMTSEAMPSKDGDKAIDEETEVID